MSSFARSSVILMTLRLKIFPVFMYPDCFWHNCKSKAQHNGNMCKTITTTERDKSGNMVSYPKAENPSPGAVLAAGTYGTQLNVCPDGWIPSYAACSGGQSPCLCTQDWGHTICCLAKSTSWSGQHPKSTAVPGVSVALPCPEVQLLTVILCSKQGDAKASL